MSDKQATLPTRHQRQYVDFRVVVYRLHIPGSITVGKSTVPINDVLSADFASHFYQEISGELSKSTGTGGAPTFSPFLDKLYSSIKSALMDGDVAKRPSVLAQPGVDGIRVFHEIDITPLVHNVDINLDLEEANRCSIVLMDPREVDFRQLELDRYKKVSPVANFISLSDLKGFAFSEFDLVRVFVSTAYDATAASRIASLEKKLVALGYPSDSGKTFFMRPAFTGLVVDIEEHNAVGSTATMSVNCLGIRRTFMQSVTTASDALASVITAAAPELGVLDNKFTTFLNSFTNLKANEIVKKIFDDYFVVNFLPITPGKDAAIGVPGVAKIISRMGVEKEFNGIKIKSNLIPMLPTVILFHLLKLKYREAIVLFDDRLKGPTEAVSGSLRAGTTTVPFKGSAPAGDLTAILEPYLFRVRDTFANFDTSYVSPDEIFRTIRETTYMEIFEDRTGAFHFRFPQYNRTQISHEVGLDETISSGSKRDDSAVYSCNVSQRMIPVEGSTGAIDGRVFVDKLSILRYGFRRPQTLENPNAVNEAFAVALAKFVRDYKSGRELRTATVVKLGDPSIDVGQMVIFHHGRPRKANLAGNIESVITRTYAGYVLGISESITVSGQYTQTLRLGFVREATVMDMSGFVGPLQPVNQHGSAWEASQMKTVRSTDNWKTKAPLDSEPTSGTVNDYLSLLDIERSSYVPSSYRYIPSALDLAKESSKPINIAGAAAFKDLLNRPDPNSTGASGSDYSAALDSVIAQIKARVDVLGDWKEKERLLNVMSGLLLQAKGLYQIGQSFNKKNYLSAGSIFSPGIAKENGRGTVGATVAVSVEGVNNTTSVVIDGKNVQFTPSFNKGRSVPHITFSMILDQTAENNQFRNPSFKKLWQTVFVDINGGVNKSNASILDGPYVSISRDLIKDMIDTVQGAAAALKAMVQLDTEIDLLVLQARELEKAKAEAKVKASASVAVTQADFAAASTNPAMAGLAKPEGIGSGPTVVSSGTTAAGFPISGLE